MKRTNTAGIFASGVAVGAVLAAVTYLAYVLYIVWRTDHD